MAGGGARRLGTALLAGAVVGLVILGVGGRIAMRVIAIVAGQAPGFSVGGTLAVVLLGGMWGAPGGPIVLALRRVIPRSAVLRGVVLGAMGFGVAMLTVGRALSGPVTGPGVWPIAVALCAALFLAYGIVVDLVVGKTREAGSGKREALPLPPTPPPPAGN